MRVVGGCGCRPSVRAAISVRDVDCNRSQLTIAHGCASIIERPRGGLCELGVSLHDVLDTNFPRALLSFARASFVGLLPIRGKVGDWLVEGYRAWMERSASVSFGGRMEPIFINNQARKAVLPGNLKLALRGPGGEMDGDRDATVERFSKGMRVFMSESRYRSAELLRKAAEMHHIEATVLLAWLQLWGCGMPQDRKAAADAFREAVVNGSTTAKAALACCLVFASGCKEDMAAGVRLARESIEAGCDSGLAMLGYCLLEGYGVEVDVPEAVALFRKAAANGESYAMGGLGFAFEHGFGVPRSEIDAFAWYQKAAQLGNLSSMLFCALMEKGTACTRWRAAVWLNGNVETHRQYRRFGISLK